MPQATHKDGHILRVSETTQALLGEIAGRMGVSRDSALEQVVREKAESEGIEMPAAMATKHSSVARTAAEVYAIAEEIAALGETATLGPAADSRESIYGGRA